MSLAEVEIIKSTQEHSTVTDNKSYKSCYLAKIKLGRQFYWARLHISIIENGWFHSVKREIFVKSVWTFERTSSTMALLSGSWKVDISIFFIGAITIFYWVLRRKYNYWDRKGFKTLPGYNYILGHFKKLFIDRLSFADFLTELYKSTNEPFIGIYGIFRPILLVRHPELIQSILIKDFSHFTDRKWSKPICFVLWSFLMLII